MAKAILVYFLDVLEENYVMSIDSSCYLFH